MPNPKSLADAVAALPPAKPLPHALGPKLEAAGLVEQVLELYRQEVPVAKIARALAAFGIKVTANPVRDFCRAHEAG